MSTGSGVPTWFRRLARTPPWVVDALLALVALLTGLLSATSTDAGGVAYEARDAWALVLIALATLPFAARSSAPIAVLLVTATAVIVLSASGYSEGVLPLWLLVGAGTVGARCPVRRVVATGAFVALELVALLVLSDRGFGAADLVAWVGLFSAALAVGSSVQSRRLRVEALEERAAALESSRAEEAKLAVADERLRIAQELHDVVAHTMGVIAVQAGMGAHVIDADPDEAKRALDSIAATSRSSLAELRRLLGVLRDADGSQAYAPAPGLADLDRLAADVTAAGVPVDLVVEGDADGVTPGAELVAYRIVQEALTNVLKHAGPARATVHVAHRPGAMQIEVCDDGRGAAVATAATGGHGLVGMRERVGVYGGTIEVGPSPGGGFRVVATLPYRSVLG